MARKRQGSEDRDGLASHMTFRISPELRERLEQAKGDRTLGEEIRQRLEASFDRPAPSADPRFSDLLTTIAYAASAAARMYPARKVRVSQAVARHMFPEERIDPAGKEVEDITAHWLLEACLSMLLDAFRPNGVPGSLPENTADAPQAGQAELIRRADRIVGAALGMLGNRAIDAFDRLAPIDQETIAASGPVGRRLAAEAEKRADERDDDD
jgi:hypothetical protein